MNMILPNIIGSSPCVYILFILFDSVLLMHFPDLFCIAIDGLLVYFNVLYLCM